MRKILFILKAIAIIFISSAFLPLRAQVSSRDDKVYQATSARLRAELWSTKLAYFDDYKLPEKFKGHSKVILADYSSLTAGDAAQVKHPLAKFTNVHRQLIKLNDAAAVKEYSQIGYRQLRKIKYYENYKAARFIGVRIIKEDGKIEEVPADEIVFTKSEAEERNARLAVPNLQPGDVLDFFTVDELSVEYELIRTLPYYFELYNDAPVLHQSVHCAIGKKFATEYRCYNGAPDFKVSKYDDDAGTMLDLSIDSILYVAEGTRWIAPLRQFPIIELNIVRGDAVPYTPFTRRKPGDLVKDQDPERIIRDEMIDLNFIKPYLYRDPIWNTRIKNGVVDAYYSALLKGGKRIQEDSAVAELYYMFRFDYMFGRLFSPNAEKIANLAKSQIDASAYAYLFSEYCKRHGMAAELLISTTSSNVRMKELMDKKAMKAICNVPGTHDKILGASSLYSPAFYIPAAFEGTPDAVAINTKGESSKMASDYTVRRISIPRSDPEANQHRESLSLMPDLANNSLRVARTTSLIGHCKNEIQTTLLLIEDFYDYERSYFNDEYTLAERLKMRKSTGEAADELTAAFAAARAKQKEDFLDEAKSWLQQEVTDQANINIVNPGVRHTAPAFEYGSTFRVNGLLKKAGSNYLLEVGKLTGNPKKVEAAQRIRTTDVYLPYAVSEKIEMNIRVPEGYAAEGLDVLNKSIKSNVGTFAASASLDGSIVTITVESAFSSSYYAYSDWPNVLAILDAMSDWTNSKILLRKKA